MKELLSKPSPNLRLLARTGFNYLHSQGKNYQAGVGKHLQGGTRIQVLLESPYSQLAEARRRAAPATARWDKIPPVRIRRLLDLYPENLKIRFTESPVYCSLFFTCDSVIYDPYHLGRRSWAGALRVGNQFLVFEFEKPPREHLLGPRDYYSLLEGHFEFLWDDEKTKTFEELCTEHPEDLGQFIS
jgi:hypothetical protein